MSANEPKVRPASTIVRLDRSEHTAADLQAGLIRRCSLREDDLRRIGLIQDQLGLGFVEAAMRLGLVNQTDLDAVVTGEAAPAPGAVAIARPSTEIVCAHDNFQPYAENMRVLRTELMFRAPEDDANLMVIIGAEPGEGRTRLSAELAVSFSQLGQPTLLIDCDLRRSRLHAVFGASNEEGLSGALGRGALPVLQPVVGIPNLNLITAGPRPDNPLELLSDPLFGELLKGWKRRHRHIIIDTPPTALFSDGLAVATHGERAVLVARKNHSMLASVKDLVQRLNSARASVIGSVFNDF